MQLQKSRYVFCLYINVGRLPRFVLIPRYSMSSRWGSKNIMNDAVRRLQGALHPARTCILLRAFYCLTF